MAQPRPASSLSLPSALDPAYADRCRRPVRDKGAVFLDYDGTLTPIVARPELAILSPAMRSTLHRLASRVPLSIVSGRDVAAVAKLVALDEVGYVGSHGLDIQGPPITGLRKEVAHDFLPELDAVETELRRRTADVAGVLIERKRFSLSTHIRQVAPTDRSRVDAIVEEVRSRYPSLRREGGKMLIELRPDIDWDKGAAVLWLLHGYGTDPANALFIGDDLTDESVFRVLAGRGTGIIVADTDRPTHAELRLSDPTEVRTLLDVLIGV